MEFNGPKTLYFREHHIGSRYCDFDAPFAQLKVVVTEETHGFAVWKIIEEKGKPKPFAWEEKKEDAIDQAVFLYEEGFSEVEARWQKEWDAADEGLRDSAIRWGGHAMCTPEVYRKWREAHT